MMPDQATLFTPPLSDPTANTRGKMHRHPRDTERRAAQLVQPRTGSKKLRILAFIAAKGYHGATDWELVEALDILLSSVNSARNSLKAGGWIFDSGQERRTARTGMDGAVWVLTPAGQKRFRLKEEDTA